jgi:hypothetical protein
VAEYKEDFVAFFGELLGLPDNYDNGMLPSQALCYPDLGHLPFPFNNTYSIPIPFLSTNPQSPYPPLCKNVPGRMSANPDAVCTFRYKNDDGDYLDTDRYPCKSGCWYNKVASYDLVTYQNTAAALADKAFITHEGGE